MSTAHQTRAWLTRTVHDFLAEDPNAHFGHLAQAAANSGLTIESDQVQAWQSSLPRLRDVLKAAVSADPKLANAGVLIEYEIPRRQKRIDVVILFRHHLLVIEFKTSAQQIGAGAIWQAEDYALDLRDFHLASREMTVHPYLVITDDGTKTHTRQGTVLPVTVCSVSELATELANHGHEPGTPKHLLDWEQAPYDPTPNVIQATCEIFKTHSVENINRSSADNLQDTLDAIRSLAKECQSHGKRGVCFVTGVPGSGKTLAGLAAVHAGGDEAKGAFLSGNSPLITVLREAIARDAAKRHGTKASAARYAETMIQNVHKFVEEYGLETSSRTPPEHLIVFDEAQRAWHADKLSKKRRDTLPSEPTLTLRAMARQPDWCLIVALIGEGQEIHDGEAGIEEWSQALAESEHAWLACAHFDRLRTASGGDIAARLRDAPHIELRDHAALHLSTVIRSPRASALSEWVAAVLDGQPERAAEHFQSLTGFRIALCRQLETAKHWLRDAARDEMRPGLVASSGARRLRAEGLELDPGFQRAFPIERWFLDEPDDIRSSHKLEVAMTEFSCQGLELDLAAVCWGGDLLYRHNQWSPRSFRGSKWQRVKDTRNQQYLINKYRVLLTRAREGMIIWVPTGDPDDPTRDPTSYDTTATYLQACGVPLHAGE